MEFLILFWRYNFTYQFVFQTKFFPKSAMSEIIQKFEKTATLQKFLSKVIFWPYWLKICMLRSKYHGVTKLSTDFLSKKNTLYHGNFLGKWQKIQKSKKIQKSPESLVYGNLDLDRFFFHFCRSVKSFMFSVKFSKLRPQRAKKLVPNRSAWTNFLARCGLRFENFTENTKLFTERQKWKKNRSKSRLSSHKSNKIEENP